MENDLFLNGVHLFLRSGVYAAEAFVDNSSDEEVDVNGVPSVTSLWPFLSTVGALTFAVP